ncbi:MAG: tRNA (adenosine(37)-N6)-dimethylallyltransferase MiaA [Oscillospiraceae bacterium]|nr:tRNA (adenosine(37)-N6)-dimethylallyltransferase MiaA [Oscillospiraceae bacterium]
MHKIPLLVIGGPTASGKTGLAIDLAKALGGEIVCADSMQIYKGMEIGAASPTPEETSAVPHHLFGIFEPEENFSVARYIALASAAIREISGRGKLPVLCGGTGLYISCLIDGISFDPEMGESAQLRGELRTLAKEEGNDRLWQILSDCDPDLAKTLHPNNTGRIIRAIEVYRLSGITMSEWQKHSKTSESEYDVCYLAINYTDRQTLYRRIDQRVEQMLAGGLLDEVQALAARNLSGTAAQAIGHKEFAAYLKGEQTLAEAAEMLKRQTRRYAKRQLTWLRRDARIHWLVADSFDSYSQMFDHALATVREKLTNPDKCGTIFTEEHERYADS